MADREITFEACGRSWTLRYTQRALRGLEKDHQVNLDNVFDSFASPAKTAIILLAGLEGKRCKDDPKAPPFTADQADAILEELGSMPASDLACQALQLALNGPKKPAEDPGGAEGKAPGAG